MRGKSPLVVDIETDGLPAQVGQLSVVGYQLVGDEDGADWWVPGEPDAVGAEAWLRRQLADPERPVVSMTKFDPRYLRLQGWEVTGPFYDLQVMAWVLNENQVLSLDALAKRYLGLEMDKRIKRRDGKPWFLCDDGRLVPLAEAPIDEVSAYCARDVEAETQLFHVLRDRLQETAWWDYFLEEEVPFTEVLLDMEVSGLPVDLDASEQLRARLEVEASDSRAELLRDASLPPGFNLNSGDQLASYLYGKVVELSASLDLGADAVECLKSCLDGEHEDCPSVDDGGGRDSMLEQAIRESGDWAHVMDLLPEGFVIDRIGRTQVHGWYTFKGRGITPTEKTKGGDRWSTASPVLKSNLAAMQDPWVVDLLAYRKVEKVLTTYLRVFPKNGLNELGENYGEALCRVRSALRPGSPQREAASGALDRLAVLQPSLLAGGCGPGGPGEHEAGRVSERQGPGEPGTPGGDGGAPSSAPPSLRGGASPQRGQVGQPAGEPAVVLVPERAPEAPLGDFRLYCRFNQTGTKTGRLSSSESNLQNIPAHGPLGEAVRGLFRGSLVVGDYSQLEPRLMAHFSEDPLLLDVYRSGRDIYLATAEGIFGREVEKDSTERGICKTLVLAMGYGAGPGKVAQILTVNGFPTDEPTARGYLNELRSLYSTFFSWREAVISVVARKGYVTTLGGRHRRLKAAFEDRRNWKNVGYGERQAVNAVVQGSAGDIVRKVMVHGTWQHEQRLLAQVHDELVWEWDALYPPTAQQLEYIGKVGENAHGFKLNVPLVFEPHFGPSWFAAKEGIDLTDLTDLTDEPTTGFEEE